MYTTSDTINGMPRSGLPTFATIPVGIVCVGVAILLSVLSGRYGFHRDELYFVVAGDHLAWGYADQPPLTPLLAKLSTGIFGDSLAGLRVIATLTGVAIVAVVALITRELGGDRAAQTLAAVGTAVSAFPLAIAHMVSTTTFDLLIWLVVCWLVLRLIRSGDHRWWLAIGALVGVGLQNKHLIVLLVVALIVALLIVGPRQIFRSWWLVAGAAIGLAIAAPNIWWQAQHDWPQLDIASGIGEDDGAENRLLFIPDQLTRLSPLLVPIWIVGLIRLWRNPALRWARAFGLAYPVICVLVLIMGGKSYYVLPLLLVLLAAGAEPVVDFLRRGRTRIRVAAAAAALVVAGVISAVIVLPILPASSAGAVAAINPEQGEQLGWPELTEATAAGWSKIPAKQRDKAVIFTSNYGEAGAIAQYRDRHDLPMPYSGHMSFADWGPPSDTMDGPVLVVHPADGGATMSRYFVDCRTVGEVDNGIDVDNEEQEARIVLCGGTTAPWSEIWPKLRHLY